MAEEDIEPTWKFFLRWFISIVALPVYIVLSFKNEEYKSKIFDFVKIPLKFFFEAKTTAILVLLNIGIYFTIAFLVNINVISQRTLESWIFTPYDLKSISVATFFKILFSTFMHANIIHLLSNMFFLHLFGRLVERKYGSVRTIIIYLVGGYISMIASGYYYANFLGQHPYMLGASGAVMGFVGVAMLINPFKISFSMGIPLPVVVLGWLQIASDLTGILSVGDVNHVAHLAGMLSMVILVYLFSSDRSGMGKGLAINLISIVLIFFARGLFSNPFDLNSVFSIVKNSLGS